MSKIAKNDIILQREQAQEDVRCILDGMDQSVIDNVCQVIVDRFNALVPKED